jgi:hypothetical protein
MPRGSSAACWAGDPAYASRGSVFFDALSSGEPAATSLENVMALDFLRLKHDIPASNPHSSKGYFKRAVYDRSRPAEQ